MAIIKPYAGGVSVLTGRRVVRVDPDKQEAVLHDGTVIRQEIQLQKLVIMSISVPLVNRS